MFEHVRLLLLCKLGRTSSMAAFSNIPKVGAKLKHWSWIFNAVLYWPVLFAASAVSLAVRGWIVGSPSHRRGKSLWNSVFENPTLVHTAWNRLWDIVYRSVLKVASLASLQGKPETPPKWSVSSLFIFSLQFNPLFAVSKAFVNAVIHI